MNGMINAAEQRAEAMKEAITQHRQVLEEETRLATVELLAQRQRQLDAILAEHQAHADALAERARLAEIAVTAFEQRLVVLRQQAAAQLGLTVPTGEEG